MGKIKDWIMIMEQDATTMDRGEWVRSMDQRIWIRMTRSRLRCFSMGTRFWMTF